MSPKHNVSSDITYLTFIALLGLLLIVMLTFFPPTTTENIPWRKPLIGSIFSTICILGCLAVFSPTQCSKIFKNKKKNSDSKLDQLFSHSKSSSMQGHHPRCGSYTAHTFRVKGRIFCAACVGLLLGGLLALSGTLLYFFVNWHIAEHSSLLVSVGGIGVGSGLFQYKFRSLTRLSLNTAFVLGTFLILIGIDEMVHSLMIDLFVVSLILFWLYTRVSLSQWDHERICSDCRVVDCDWVN